ncbi:MAG: alpha/beta hydrolase [Chitinophagales bacterium]|nr:alpha/beta hydrolase [Chitinophagales bacterium]
MQIYFIPGLGADRRMYYHQLKLFPQAIVLEHLPAVKGESLPAYAKRVAALIDSSSPFILVGTSLGGMISMEISRILKPEKLILISSVKNRSELPGFIRSMKYLNLHRLFSGKTYQRLNKIAARRLDSRSDSEAAQLIKAMMLDMQPEFIEWAINAVINWHPPIDYRADVVHIHGSNDLLFPIRKIKNSIVINNGTHIMNITMSKEVNQHILAAINSL